MPQREPFLFVDEVIEIDGTQKIVAVKYIRKEESYFSGHFPGKPIMPGVLIIEAMAQTSILLYGLYKPDLSSSNPEYYLGKVKSEFLSPVFPGDKLVIEANRVKITDDAAIVDALARVGENIVAKANLIFRIKRK